LIVIQYLLNTLLLLVEAAEVVAQVVEGAQVDIVTAPLERQQAVEVLLKEL